MSFFKSMVDEITGDENACLPAALDLFCAVGVCDKTGKLCGSGALCGDDLFFCKLETSRFLSESIGARERAST